MTDVVVFPYKSPLSMMCGVMVGCERATKWCSTLQVSSQKQQQYCSVLVTITWLVVFETLPLYLHNDHLPVTGPCESHYPWFNRRWQRKGMERMDTRWQALHFLMSPSCLQGEESQPPLLQWIHRATKVIKTLQHQTQGLCFLFLGSHIFTHWCAPWRAAYQLCTR